MCATRPGKGFTLVELLVVLAIVSVIVAMMIPAIGEARESARRVKCMTNLRAIGLAGSVFANDRKGYFPRALLGGQNRQIFANASRVSVTPGDLVSTGYSNAETYEFNLGTSLQTWHQYLRTGIDPALLASEPLGTLHRNREFGAWACPSIADQSLGTFIFGGQGGWSNRLILGTPYMYLAGYPSGPAYWVNNYYEGRSLVLNSQSMVDAANHRPAVGTFDSYPASTSLLALDPISTITTTSPFGDNHGINHGIVGDPNSHWWPAYFNVLYADGRVVGEKKEYFRDTVTGAILSVPQTGKSAGNSSTWCFYWGR